MSIASGAVVGTDREYSRQNDAAIERSAFWGVTLKSDHLDIRHCVLEQDLARELDIKGYPIDPVELAQSTYGYVRAKSAENTSLSDQSIMEELLQKCFNIRHFHMRRLLNSYLPKDLDKRDWS